MAEESGLIGSGLYNIFRGVSSAGESTIASLRSILSSYGYPNVSLLALRSPTQWPLPRDFLHWPTADDLSRAAGEDPNAVTKETLRALRNRVRQALLTVPETGSLNKACQLADVNTSNLNQVLLGHQRGTSVPIRQKLRDLLRSAGYDCDELLVLADPAAWRPNSRLGMSVSIADDPGPVADAEDGVQFIEPSDDELRSIPPEERTGISAERLAAIRQPITDSLISIYGSIPNLAVVAGVDLNTLLELFCGRLSGCNQSVFVALKRALDDREHSNATLTALKAPEHWPLPRDFLLWPSRSDLAAAVADGISTVPPEELVRLRARIAVAVPTLPGVFSVKQACALANLDPPNLSRTLSGALNGMRAASLTKLQELLQTAGYERPDLKVLENPKKWPRLIIGEGSSVETSALPSSPTEELQLMFDPALPADLAAIKADAMTSAALVRATRYSLLGIVAQVLNATPQFRLLAPLLGRTPAWLADQFNGRRSVKSAQVSALLQAHAPLAALPAEWFLCLQHPQTWPDAEPTEPNAEIESITHAQRLARSYRIPSLVQLARLVDCAPIPRYALWTLRQRLLAFLCALHQTTPVLLYETFELAMTEGSSAFNGGICFGDVVVGRIRDKSAALGIELWMLESPKHPDRWPRLG